MARGIIIGATHYPTKEAVRDVYRGIVQRYGIGGDVTDPDDDSFLRLLLERHPEYDLKRGDGIAHFRVIAHTGYGRRSVGLALVRLDGEVSDFSTTSGKLVLFQQSDNRRHPRPPRERRNDTPITPTPTPPLPLTSENTVARLGKTTASQGGTACAGTTENVGDALLSCLPEACRRLVEQCPHGARRTPRTRQATLTSSLKHLRHTAGNSPVRDRPLSAHLNGSAVESSVRSNSQY
ncbi:DCL family protein [Streptomyces sp. NPDC057381]|uniref:DCL family protein n=1 Tax=Streptomyces sp. NPDC057381 TaxID=3346111 RepID=UPI0036268D28